jgi:flagellar biogenesis protein FliO
LAEARTRKRAVSARHSVADAATVTRRRRAPVLLEDEAPLPDYALRLTEARDRDEDDDGAPDTNFSLKLNEALAAIARAQLDEPAVAPRAPVNARQDEPVRAKGMAAPADVNELAGRSRADTADTADTDAELDDEALERTSGTAFGRWLAVLDKMPPIRLPIGPAIPWRFGLPALVAIIVIMTFVARPSGRVDAQPVRIPTPEPYAVQQDAPLFANSAAQAAPTAQPLGVPEPAGASFDIVDVGFKLIAVLALAYGSMMLLKRAGMGGGIGRAGSTLQGMRVVSTLALAPNRTVHVLKVPGGKTLLVGATPNAVNLIADLGELAEDETPEASSFFDALKSKISN